MLTQDNRICQELFGTKQCYSLRPVVGPENIAAFLKIILHLEKKECYNYRSNRVDNHLLC